MFKKIMFSSDFSENSRQAFTYAINLARTFHARLLILHVIRGPVYPEQLLYYLPPKKLEEQKALRIERIENELNNHYLQKIEGFKEYEVLLREGAVFYEIIEVAKKESVDVIVIGRRRKKGIIDILFGSTSEILAKESPCPVLIV